MPKDFSPFKPDPKNANAGTVRGRALLEDSLRNLGAGRSVLADRNGVLIAGNKTMEAAVELGIPTRVIQTDGNELVVVQRTDLDLDEDTRARALAFADNRIAELDLSWDPDELLDALESDVDLAAVGFDEDELDALLAGLDQPDAAPVAGPEAASIPEPRDAAITRPGDLWQIGAHRLICGDCRDFGTVQRLLGRDQASIVVTSPPYASQRAYDPSSGFTPIPVEGYVEWYRDVAANIMAALADDGSYFLNIKAHADGGQRALYVMDLALAHARDWGWRYVDEFCWRNARDGVPGAWPNRFKNAWEPVYHFARQERIKFRPEAVKHETENAFDYSPKNSKAGSGSGLLGSQKAGGYRDGLARPSNVIEATAESAQGEHTAPFPLALPIFFIRAFTDAGDVVLDPFAGAGTTLVAADNCRRAGRAIEISPIYCDVILRRMVDLTGLDPVRDDGARWSDLSSDAAMREG